MPRDPIYDAVLEMVILQILDEAGPLLISQIEAHVILKRMDVITFEVQRAVKRLVDGGVVTQTDDLCYKRT